MVESLRRDGFVRNIDVRVRTSTGAERMVYLSAELMEITGQSCIFAVARDVTAREESLSALQHQATLLDLACEAIVVIDRDDLVTYGNDAASKLLGAPAQEMRGRPLAEVLATPDPAEVGAASRATRERGVWHGTLKAGTATGGKLHLDVVWSLVTDAEGDATAKLIFLR
jgi:PAS domain S-box-containing protein